MASIWVQTDTGNDTTGTGTEINPYKTFSKGYQQSSTYDILYLGGTIPSVITFNTINRQFVQDPKDADHSHQISWTLNTNLDGMYLYGLSWDISTFLNYDTSYSTATYENCRVFTSAALGVRTAPITSASGSARANQQRWINCDFDMTNITEFSSGTTSKNGTHYNCRYFNWNNTASYSSMFQGFIYMDRCSFYDNEGANGLNSCLIEQGNYYNSSIKHCNFLMKSTEVNVLQMFRLSSGANVSFTGNIISGGDTVYTQMQTNTTTALTSLMGNNLFHNTTPSAAYTAGEFKLTDYTDTSSPWISDVVGNADFMKIKSTSNGIGGDTLVPNLDVGANQSAPTGFPALAVELVKIGVDTGDGSIGTYVAAERYTDPLIANVRDGIDYQFNSETNNRSGEYTVACDFPLESKVQVGIEYDNGTLTGTLGTINRNNPDITGQIRTNITAELTKELPTYTALDYLEDLNQNNFRANSTRYGVRPLDLTPTNNLIGSETVARGFEIILTNSFINKKTDSAQRLIADGLRDKLEILRRIMRETKGGCYNQARDARDFSEIEVEYSEEDNVAIGRLQFFVHVRIK